MSAKFSRRGFVIGAGALLPAHALAQGRGNTPPPPGAAVGKLRTVISDPPREWGPDAPPQTLSDPDILSVDPAFGRLRSGHAYIRRISTGYTWAEGPAWSGEGQYVVFSDVETNIQYRYIWETGEVTVYHRPSYNTNGFQGRQISCQGFFRRVVRWEPDGSLTVIADRFEGKALNSPNDVVPHPDGSIWFTDPKYGGSLSQGHTDEPGTGNNAAGLSNPYLGDFGLTLPSRGQKDALNGMTQQLPTNTYRWDPSGPLELVVTDKWGSPNGLAFSPDYKLLYTMGSGNIYVSDVEGTKLTNTKVLTDCMVDGVRCGADGMRVDRGGNLWIGSTSIIGYAGVTVWNAAGKLLGRIRLPESCANLCFAGPKRDYLFMAASQSTYMVQVNIQGASPG